MGSALKLVRMASTLMMELRDVSHVIPLVMDVPRRGIKLAPIVNSITMRSIIGGTATTDAPSLVKQTISKMTLQRSVRGVLKGVMDALGPGICYALSVSGLSEMSITGGRAMISAPKHVLLITILMILLRNVRSVSKDVMGVQLRVIWHAHNVSSSQGISTIDGTITSVRRPVNMGSIRMTQLRNVSHVTQLVMDELLNEIRPAHNAPGLEQTSTTYLMIKTSAWRDAHMDSMLMNRQRNVFHVTLPAMDVVLEMI